MPSSANRIIGTLQRAGFRGSKLRDAFGIVMAESGGNPRAYNGKGADRSYGLSQINMLGSMGPARRKQFGLGSNADLYDPDVNARVMFRMSGGGRDFTPWSTFKSGAFRSHKFPGAAPSGEAPGPAAAPSAAPAGAPSPRMVRTPGALSTRTVVDPRVMLALQLVQSSRRRRGESGSSPILEALRMRARRQETFRRPASYAPAPPALPVEMDERPQGQAAARGGFLQAPTNWAYDGTHAGNRTDGLGWGEDRPEDIMGRPGTSIGAPEDGVITRHGSAQGGESVYFKADSGQEYWLGHIASDFPVGKRVKRGQVIASIADQNVSAPHLHIAKRP